MFYLYKYVPTGVVSKVRLSITYQSVVSRLFIRHCFALCLLYKEYTNKGRLLYKVSVELIKTLPT